MSIHIDSQFQPTNNIVTNEYNGNDTEDILVEYDMVEYSFEDEIKIEESLNPMRHMTWGEVERAKMHISLWRELASSNNESDTMLIFEDDVIFHGQFADAFSQIWEFTSQQDWAFLYLGLSDRGRRNYVFPPGRACSPSTSTNHNSRNNRTVDVEIFQPSFGYQNRAYAITRAAAIALLSHLPLSRPTCGWLSRDKWFGISVYCGVVTNGGWRLEDGTYEGAWLVYHKKNVKATKQRSRYSQTHTLSSAK